MCESDVHCEKAELPIELTNVGIFISSIETQLKNAESSIF